MSELVKLGSLWKVDNRKENSPILTGSMDNARIVIFPNKHKGEGANRPDFILYVQNREKKQETEQDNFMDGVQPPHNDLPF